MMRTEVLLPILNTAYVLSAAGFAVSVMCAAFLFFRLRIPDVVAFRRNRYGGGELRRMQPGKGSEKSSAGYAGSPAEKEKTRRESDIVPHKIPADPGAGEKGDTIRLDMLPAEGLTSWNRKTTGGQIKQSGCGTDGEIPFEIIVNTAIIHTQEIV